MKVWRDGRNKTLKVQVAEMGEPDDLMASATSDDTSEQLGLTLAPLSDAYRVRPGDLITRVNGRAVNSPGAVAKEIDADQKDGVLMLIRRGDSQYFAALALS